VYVALCYYKLDYYDVSQEVLAVYLQQFPDSAIAINLKACNHFRLYNGKAAETEIKSLMASLLKYHNHILFHLDFFFTKNTAAGIVCVCCKFETILHLLYTVLWHLMYCPTHIHITYYQYLHTTYCNKRAHINS
jgi:hypothetical protein